MPKVRSGSTTSGTTTGTATGTATKARRAPAATTTKRTSRPDTAIDRTTDATQRRRAGHDGGPAVPPARPRLVADAAVQGGARADRGAGPLQTRVAARTTTGTSAARGAATVDVDALVRGDPAIAKLGLFARDGSLVVNGAWDRERGAIRATLDASWDVSASPKADVADARFGGAAMHPLLRGYYPIDKYAAPAAVAARAAASSRPQVPDVGAGDPLDQLLAGILIHGVSMGLALVDADVRSRLRVQDVLGAAADAVKGTNEFPRAVFGRPSLATPSLDDETDRVVAWMRRTWDVRAAPVGYAAAKQRRDGGAPATDAPAFTGAPLHVRLGAVGHGFARAVSRDEVLRGDVDQGRSPLHALVGAVLRQGMNIALHVGDATYGAALDRRQDAIAATIRAAT